MNIGEFWIKLGVKDDGSWRKAMTNLHKLTGATDKLVSQLGSAARNTASEWAKLELATSRVGAVAASTTRSIVGGVNAQRDAFKSATFAATKMGDAIEQSMKRSARFKGSVLPDLAGAVGVKGGIPRPGVSGAVANVRNLIAGGSLFSGDRFKGSKLANIAGAVGVKGGIPRLTNNPGAVSPVFKNMIKSGELAALEAFAGGSHSPGPRSGNTMIGNPMGAFAQRRSGGGTIIQHMSRPRPAAPPETPKGPGFISRFRDAFSGGGGGKGRGRGRGGGGRGGGGFIRGGLFDRRGGQGAFGPLGAASTLRRVVMGAGLFQGAQEFGQLSDTYARLQMRIEGVTSTQAEANATFERLRQIAKNTRIGLEETAEGYVRIKHATAEMKLSDADTFKLVENVNTLLSTSGASTQEAASGMRQLTQAFAKGKLDGDEFRSIAENMPNILKVLQKSLGVTEGRLRDMSEAGELTRDRLVKALLNVKDLQKPIDTFGSTWQQFKDDLMISFGVFTKENDLVADFKVVLQKLADVIVNYLLPAFAKFVKALKEGRYWAYALVGIITGSLILSFLKLAAAPFITIANGIWKIVKALRALKAAQAGAAAANVANGLGGAAGGAAAGNAAKGATKGGMLRTAGGLLAALLPRAILPAGIAAGVTYGVDKLGIRGKGSLDEGGWMDMVRKGQTPDVLRDFVGYRDPSSASSIAGNTTNIGNIDIKIEASDMADVESKMTKELMDRMMRQANPYAAGR